MFIAVSYQKRYSYPSHNKTLYETHNNFVYTVPSEIRGTWSSRKIWLAVFFLTQGIYNGLRSFNDENPSH